MKCLLRLKDGTWVHYSKGRKNTVLRRFVPDVPADEYPNGDSELKACLEVSAELSFEQADAHLVQIEPDLNLTKLSQLNVEKHQDEWRKVLELLPLADLSLPSATKPDIASTGGEGRLADAIPQTRLRRFYETLRLFSAHDLHAGFAKYLSRDGCTRHLQALFEESTAHFSRYKNPDLPFVPAQRNNPWWKNYAQRTDQPAKSLVARLQPSTNYSVEVEGEGGICLDFVPVDYEVSPRRTQDRAFFESGRSGRSSGCGGVDLLLRHALDMTPIIAEVKAPGDMNLFLALVQALNYAVEFTTRNQLRRLKKHYETHFSTLDDKGRCDVYLIFFDADPPLQKQTIKIAKELLLKKDSPVGSKVRRIALLRATFTPNDGVEFRATCVAQS